MTASRSRELVDVGAIEERGADGVEEGGQLIVPSGSRLQCHGATIPSGRVAGTSAREARPAG
ncbi:MAG TPA: hypothetical protein VM344_01640 [Vitreimonas sp.]|nr:hypothetical protein [Vitreimonas sp.]